MIKVFPVSKERKVTVMNYKPKLSYSDQIDHLKEKGVTFNKMSENDALHYLQYNSYLFKLSAYRKNYPKDITNKRYLHLEFATLVDLAVIDMYLRSLMLKMSLNIEHYAKVKLLERTTKKDGEDGYSIVADYLNSLTPEARQYIDHELERNAKSPYCRQAYAKYKDHYPLWVFIEIISFGSFISFYKYCANRLLDADETTYKQVQIECRNNQIPIYKNTKAYQCRLLIREDKIMVSNFYLLLSIKHLRNAAAHNNCIISDLRDKSPIIYHQADIRMVKQLKVIGLSEPTIINKLSNERIMEIISCLYAHKQIVSSPGVNKHLSVELHEFSHRLFQHHDYVENNLMRSTFEVIILIIDKWFPIM